MKISRFKKSHKTLTFLATNFNYHEPYQVLIDATFCQAALQNKVVVEEQIKKYFQCAVKLVTTHCIILEAESLGPKLTGATTIVKQFQVHKCSHEGKPVNAGECIKNMTKQGRYIVATQDRLLQASLRKVPGRCLLYLHKAAPVLETPSEASKKWVFKQVKQKLIPAEQEAKIVHMKEEQGLLQTQAQNKPKKKHKVAKNPNPLSCRKSKKHKQQQETKQTLKKHATMAKRKRIKIPAHVKEVLPQRVS